jgi:DNA gyrase/topoisomerase IV subunit A
MTCSTHDYLLFFTDGGNVHWLKAFEVPEVAKYGKGKALINLLDLKNTNVTSVIAVKEFKDYLMMATENGVVKKIKLKVTYQKDSFVIFSTSEIILIKLIYSYLLLN